MLSSTLKPVKKIEKICWSRADERWWPIRSNFVADVKIEDGMIKVKDLIIQDSAAAKVLAEYPEARWTEITRRALKIGLGYMKGGADD